MAHTFQVRFLAPRDYDTLSGPYEFTDVTLHHHRGAEREAAKLEKALREGTLKSHTNICWQEWRHRYEDECLTGKADSTDTKVAGVFNAVERILNPAKLSDVTAERLSHYQAELRRSGLAEDTIRGHLAHLKSALNWSTRIGLLASSPSVEMPKRVKGGKTMKGRAIALEEFERMLAVLPSVVGEAATVSWRFYLTGIWWSGLRLTESLELSWDDGGKLLVDMDSQRHPMMRIPAELEKGHRDRLLPMAPEFAEMLLSVPEDRRTGYVFNPLGHQGRRLKRFAVSERGVKIGKAAGVKVDPQSGKSASVHDLRRSFGARWSRKVTPTVLKELMRHDNVQTTLRYYVGQDAEQTADVLWQVHDSNPSSNTLGNTSDFSGNSGERFESRNFNGS